MHIMMAYWLTVCFPAAYVGAYAMFDGFDLVGRKRRIASVVVGVCITLVIVGALVGIWASALIPGLYE